MKEKQVGILTYHFVNNSGAVLQSIALQTALTKTGNFDVKVINYQPKYHTNIYAPIINPFLPAFAFIKSLDRHNPFYLIYRFVRNVFALLRKCKRPLERKKISQVFYEYYTKHLNLTPLCESAEDLKKNCSDYDIYIVGSDQLWNSNITNYYPDLNYYLAFLHNNDAIKATYAVSVNLKANEKTVVREYVKRFRYLSVREKSSINQISDMTAQENVRIDIDPTLLLDRKEYMAFEEPIDLPEQYVAFYGLATNDETELVNAINQYAKETKLPVVDISTVPYSLKCDVIKKSVYTPGQFLSVIKNADCVITNSFHGTVFSIIYNKLFYVSVPTLHPGRIYDLLEKFHLSERIVGKEKNHDNIINWAEVNEILAQARSESLQYLDLIIGTGKI